MLRHCRFIVHKPFYCHWIDAVQGSPRVGEYFLGSPSEFSGSVVLLLNPTRGVRTPARSQSSVTDFSKDLEETHFEPRQEQISASPGKRNKASRISIVTARGMVEPERRNLQQALEEREKFRAKGWSDDSSSADGLQTRRRSENDREFSRYRLGRGTRFRRSSPVEYDNESFENQNDMEEFDRNSHDEYSQARGSSYRKHQQVFKEARRTADFKAEKTFFSDRVQKRIEQSEDDRPKTAYDVVKEFRLDEKLKAAGKLDESESKHSHATKVSVAKKVQDLHCDSKGFKTYRHLTIDWTKLTKDDVVELLKKNIIYDEHGIVAINKPYGLSVHGGPSIHHSVARYLENLGATLSPPSESKLHLVNRIDKDTTGVLLLARNRQMANALNNLFLRRDVKKEYWTITKGVPNPPTGIIDIPIGDSRATGVNRRVLRPFRDGLTKVIMSKTSVSGDEAVTEYEVISSFGSAALVKLFPKTGVQHQVRLHLANGLGCPVLGDHKYSHVMKLAPQRLPKDILKSLKIRQAKVRTIPMFLHAKTLVLPEFIQGQNVFIDAPLPRHFIDFLALLKLREGKFG